jgi:hypothetical protein
MIQMVTNGALVRSKNDPNRLAMVMSNPYEIIVQMSPKASMSVTVVDVLWNDTGIEIKVPVTSLERIDRNIRR